MLTTFEIKSLEATGRLMRLMAWTYRNDMIDYATKPLVEVYAAMKKIPYRRDPTDREHLQRPSYTLKGQGDGGDCDDKAICMMAYAYLTAIPFKIWAVGRYKERPYHHVLLEFKLPTMYNQMEWVHIDATYPHNVYGIPMANYEKRLKI